jgi:hypothetical protein
MRRAFRRIGQDLKNRRNVDAYVVAAMAFVFAVLSVAGDVVGDQLRWAVLLAGVGLLVYRITLPDASTAQLDDLLNDRSDFEGRPLRSRLETARELWVFAPSAVNLLTAQSCDTLRATVLRHPEGVVRVVVLDPEDETAVRLAVRQLDDSVDYPIQQFPASLRTTLQHLSHMAGWQVAGSFDYRLLDFNPGFSLVAIDPSAKHGTVIVEFHAFHNEATASRMHLELTRQASERWYSYWIDQFDSIWRAARPPAGGGATAGRRAAESSATREAK